MEAGAGGELEDNTNNDCKMTTTWAEQAAIVPVTRGDQRASGAGGETFSQWMCVASHKQQPTGRLTPAD